MLDNRLFNLFTGNGIVSFSGLISTSNTYETASVEIKCDGTVFWAMGTAKDTY